MDGNVAQFALGQSFTCALIDDDSVRCWGWGEYGQLGYGNTDDIGDAETPASAGDVNVGGNVTMVAEGGQHTCASMQTGTVRCWGDGANGRLGYGNTDVIGDTEDPATAGDVELW